MTPATWQDWIAWAGLIIPFAALAWAAVVHVLNQRESYRQKKYEKFMDLISRYNNAAGDEPLFTQLAAAFELRNYRSYKTVIQAIYQYQNEKVAKLELDDISSDPIRMAKRELVQAELSKTVEYLCGKGTMPPHLAKIRSARMRRELPPSPASPVLPPQAGEENNHL
ncbi:hypothetical protein ACFOOP_16490 [Marinicaulis aureus]|uniref:DUF4381 domain-containing protein n=1 Tax=Hyphococcus aureus TaxID=2666033 RepID=A0ABW1KYS7_9PROT